MLPPGTTLSQTYQLAQLLGTGSTGAVFDVAPLPEQPPLIAKLVADVIRRNHEALGRLQHQYGTISKFRHASIARVYELGDDQGHTYLVREKVPGPSLAQMIREGKEFSGERVQVLLKQIVEALGYAHSMGMVHGDLKPNNIYVVPGPPGMETFKIVDFGIAPVIDPHTAAHFRLESYAYGTPGYVAPETLTGEMPSPAADFYSLGIIAYELLTGRRAFDESSPLETFKRQSQGNPDSPGMEVEILAIWRIIESMIEKEVLVRYNRAANILDDISDATNLEVEEDSTMAVPLSHLFMSAGGGGGAPSAPKGPSLDAGNLFDNLFGGEEDGPPAGAPIGSLDIPLESVSNLSKPSMAPASPHMPSPAPAAPNLAQSPPAQMATGKMAPRPPRVSNVNMPPPQLAPKPIETKSMLPLIIAIAVVSILIVVGLALIFFVL